jgi:uncharacterized lipoprotein
VTPATKWEHVHQMLQNEERYNIIKSISEKRKIFKDWVSQTKQIERSEYRQKLEKVRKIF